MKEQIRFPSLLKKFDRSLGVNGDPKISSFKDLKQYFSFTIKLFDIIDIDINLLIKRITWFYKNQAKRNNLRQVFNYLKEIYTLNNSLLVSGDYIPKLRIATDTKGRPMLIPVRLRNKYLTDRKTFVLVQTILCVHRLIKWWPDISFDTIISPFNGSDKTLPLSKLIRAKKNILKHSSLNVRNLDKFRFNLGPIKGLVMEASSPNGKRAWLNSVADAFAFYYDLKYLYVYCKFLIHNNAYLILIGLLIVLTLGLPFHLLEVISHYLNVRYFGCKTTDGAFNGYRYPLFGRLTSVLNVSGKNRVIALTNYWIQIALAPLHNSIFELLKSLKTDGTFNQMAPINNLLKEKESIETFYSFDLSAATDRLPLQLQTRILGLFLGKEYASLWESLISIDFNGIKYAVGQPMGCYSSWAMLALTHHMIVNVASPSQLYAVLGDDVVVTDSHKDNYLSIMDQLGVGITLSKSIISSTYLEFAKKVISSDGQSWSPIGPGLILNVCRDRLTIPMALSDLVFTRIHYIDDALKVLERNFPRIRKDLSFVLFSLFGPRGLINRNHHVALNSGIRWLSEDNNISKSTTEYMMQLGLLSLCVLKFRSNKARAKANLNDNYYIRYNMYVSRFGERAYFHSALAWFTPTAWLMINQCIDDYFKTELPKHDAPDVNKSIEYLRSLNIETYGTLSFSDRKILRKSFKDISHSFAYRCKQYSHLINNYE